MWPKMWRWRWMLVALVVVAVLVEEAAPVPAPPRRAGGGGGGGRREGGDRQLRLRTQHEWKRRHRKSSECKLGKRRYGLGEVWNPNLGPPFGVWSCVQCHCAKVQRKRRVVARVQCRNIKDECPKVTCAEPVLLPGACCKTCPDSDSLPVFPAMPGDQPAENSHEELSGRDFAVLLNGRTSQSPMTTVRVATGRISLRRRALHFSFLLEDGVPSPSSVQFMSEDGDVLEQLEPQPTPYEVTNSRVCGTWTRIPREYRTMLLEEKLWVALVPPEGSGEDVISGVVARYVGVETEVFSALLTPSPVANQTLSGGGTAIVSVDRRTDSLHVSLVFNGVFAVGEAQNVTLMVELIPERAPDPVTETVLLPKVFTDLNHAEVLTTLGERSLIRLTRGQVFMKVWSGAAPELAVEGRLTPRATCNVFSAVLTPPSSPAVTESEDNSAVVSGTEVNGSGWALLTLSNDGTFQYQVLVQGLQAASVVLETQHRRRHRRIHDLTPTFRDGWANGTYDRPTYRDLDALLRGKVELVVEATEGGGVQGLLESVAVTEALRSPLPVLLAAPTVPMAATVWLAVDAACVTHYDVLVGGKPPGGAREPAWSLILREYDETWDPRFDQSLMKLEEQVEGRELFGHTTQLNRLTLSRLAAGVTVLDLELFSAGNTSRSRLTGALLDIAVPPGCLLGGEDEGAPMDDYEDYVGDCSNGRCLRPLDEPPPAPVSHKCIDNEKRVFEDGMSWPSPVNACSMCMCTRGVIRCLDVTCLDLDCEGAYVPPDQCCPICPGGGEAAQEQQVCELNSQRHLLGSKWHPFLAPRGFDKCVSCSCVLHSSGKPVVNCSRQPCPSLQCGPDEEVEQPPDACCAHCRPRSPETPMPTAPPGMVNEGGQLSKEDELRMVLDAGGCQQNTKLYHNGQAWHPRVASIGVYKCVTCTCKDTEITCKYQRCPTLRCQALMQEEQECCPRCTATAATQPPPRRRKPSRKPPLKPKSSRRPANSAG